MRKAILIALDGPNASGKSTIIKQVCQLLLNDGISVLIEKEPTDTPLGIFCRNNANNMVGKSLAYLVAADRLEHSKRLSNILGDYDVILLDRYYFSSFIFQCIDGLSKEEVFRINEGIVMPDIQIVLRASQKLLLERLATREKGDRFESMILNKEVQFTEEAIHFFTQKHKNVPLVIIDSSSSLSDSLYYENSISTYKIIKENLKRV